MEKEIIKFDKDSNEYILAISYKINIIDNARFMAGSSLYLVVNFVEEIH